MSGFHRQQGQILLPFRKILSEAERAWTQHLDEDAYLGKKFTFDIEIEVKYSAGSSIRSELYNSSKCWGARPRAEAAISTPGKSPAVFSNGKQKLASRNTINFSITKNIRR